jgi:hypothetical protein
MTTIRARVYEADPLVTFVERLDPNDDHSSYHEIPAHLVDAFESADQQLTAARKAVEAHIAEHRLQEHDPSWMES